MHPLKTAQRADRRLNAASAAPFEALESRTLFNATLTSAVPPQSGSAGTSSTVDLNKYFNDPLVTGTAVELATTQGNVFLSMNDTKAPKNVADFLHYVTTGGYDGTVFQRDVPGFILQGGGFDANQQHIPQTLASPPNEPNDSNQPGTVAMALSGANTATSDFFFNLANNSFLDPVTNTGGFTVVAHVLYNGMSVVNQISNLPLGQVPPTFVPNTAAGDPTNGALPLQNYSGGTITPANYVEIAHASIVPKLTYSVSSNNPALVTPSVNSSGQLTLNYGAGVGTANVTVTATDLGGNSVASIFAVTLGGTQVTLGTGGVKAIRVPAFGEMINLKGAGAASITFTGSGLTQATGKNGIVTLSGQPTGASIALTGTNAGSVLNVTGKNFVNVTSLTSNGSLRAVNGRQLDLVGGATFGGNVGTITLDSATGGVLTATSIGKLAVRGAMSTGLATGGLASATIGSITGGTWTVGGAVRSITTSSITNWTANLGSLGSLVARGAIQNSTVNVTGSIGTIAAASVAGSKFYAGVSSAGQAAGLPTTLSDVAAPSIIGSFKVNGAFSGSDLASRRLRSVTIGSIIPGNSGVPFGIAAHELNRLTTTIGGKRVRLNGATAQSQVNTALAGITTQDLVVRIV